MWTHWQWTAGNCTGRKSKVVSVCDARHRGHAVAPAPLARARTSLPVVLGVADECAGTVLCRFQPGRLASRHVAVAFGAMLHAFDVVLLARQARHFGPRQLTRSDALLDALLLPVLALVHALFLRMSERGRAEGECEDQGAKGKGLGPYAAVPPPVEKPGRTLGSARAPSKRH